MRNPHSHLTILTALCALAATASAQRFERVGTGTGRNYATPQAAINAIAARGNPDHWVVLVDPGTYPGFTIDGLAGTNHISIVSAVQGQQYVLQGVPQHVAIQNTAGQVTVADARWAYTDGATPSIMVTNCTGMVKLRNIDIELRSIFGGAQGRGVIELDNSRNNMLMDVRMSREGRPQGFTLNPNVSTPPAVNDGLCGLVIRPAILTSSVLLHEVRLIGYDNPNGTWGGDAVRVESNGPPSDARVLGTNYTQSNSLEGGNGGTYGGSCFHQIITSMQTLEFCQGVGSAFLPGTGSVSSGGSRTFDNQLPSTSFIPECPGEQWSHTEAPAVYSLGSGTLSLVVDSRFTRSYALYGDMNPTVFGSYPGFSGLLWLDPLSFFYLTSGVINVGGTPVNLPIPNDVSLIGRQVVFQAIAAPAGSSTQWAFGTPAATTFVQ